MDPRGALANSSAAETPNGMHDVDKAKAEHFWQNLQTRFVAKRHSRYSQPIDVEDIPKESIAIFLQGDNPQRWGTAYCDPETMIRTVVAHAQGRPVVVKAHPASDLSNERKMLLRLMHEGLDLFLTDANIHDILRQCAVTVSFNSAVAIEGFLHNKPAVLFGRSDFHHCCETVQKPDDFPDALDRALTRSWDYRLFLYWYFTTFCFSPNDPHVDDAILNRFDEIGFSPKRLGLTDPSPWMKKLLTKQNAAQALETYLLDRPEVERARKFKALKVTDKSWVFAAQINGKKVVVKRFLEQNAEHTVRSLKGELDYLETVFGDGDCQANRCLMSWPKDGVVVLSFVPGSRLGDKIAASRGPKRRALMAHSAKWLATYTAPRRRDSTFGPRFWIKQLLGKDLSHIDTPADLQLLRDLIDALRSQRDRVMGSPVVQAATHGDFVGINAHYHAGVIYGVDIQGECWLAIAREAARFLVWLQVHDPNRPERRHAGIDADDWTAFLSVGVLPAAEHETTLPFFVGEQLYGRYVESYERQDIRENTRAAIEAYISSYR
ncbi:hypothetical protein ACERZ8_12930 [Tateyamaria armeniaca]|uniref:Capsular biosynthesis protein n=1 Tax=Tateyamaria armeniaca TaxID=2518930 RepID=A0ABW8UYJ0_9RHOB